MEHFSHFIIKQMLYSVRLNKTKRYQIFKHKGKKLFHTLNDISTADKQMYQCDDVSYSVYTTKSVKRGVVVYHSLINSFNLIKLL